MNQDRVLHIKFAGRLIDLLGQQMYGGAVPSIAELVANAWDADAKEVDIFLPDDVSNEGAEIVVRDYGVGMTFKELNDYYLHIGYERRNRGERTNGGRLVMGRKGIGKLAGFGIAEDIIVTSIKDGNLIEIKLNYSELRSLDTTGTYPLEPLRDEKTSEKDGVKITFKSLKLSRSINIDSFRTSMSRRFALGMEFMKIRVNGTELSKEELDFEHRVPSVGWADAEIEGFGKVKYWFGFLTSTIRDAELRGISIFARERVAQFTPFFFNLSGGINGQVGLEYLTGQIKADTLDNDIDYIATDRQTVNWQFDKAPIFEEWGKQKIKELCSDWKKRREKKNVDRFKHSLGEFYPRIDNLATQQEKTDLTNALTKIATIETINEHDFKLIATAMVSGVERESVRKVIRRINTASDEALPELFEAIKEWDIISAVATAEVVYGKIEIIKQFNKLIKERTPEKSPRVEVDMQNFVLRHPWLLGPDYETLKAADFSHERGVDKWIKEIIVQTDGEPGFRGEREDKRFDIVCIKNDFFIVVLELMRPGKAADYDHASRLVRYVTRIEAGIKSKGSHEKFRRMSVYGLLIADDLTDDPSLSNYFQSNRGFMDYISWGGLFDMVSGRYNDFFEMLKEKAPEDPRLKGLVTKIEDEKQS